MKRKLRKHGKSPYNIVIIHGGPGAPGGVKAIAQYLGKTKGVLEPFQTMDSVEGQVLELHQVLKAKANIPVVLIGFSWGAWLAILYTVRFQKFVNKIILVGSGPLEDKYAKTITKTREDRITSEEKKEIHKLLNIIEDPDSKDRENAFARFGEIFLKTDSYDPIPNHQDNVIEFQPQVFNKVWPEANELRKTGKLLEITSKLTCPVTAIHGDYDPHPYEGVKIPLSKIISNFKFHLLKKCGHEPWIEKHAYKEFYEILNDELSV